MALFQKTKDPTEAAPSLPRPQVPMAAPGEAAAECMRVGKILVDIEQLSAENLASSLSSANGDLLQFADIVLRAGVGRAELAKAISEVTEIPALDSKAIELPDNAKDFLDERVVRANCVIAVADDNGTLVVIAADPTAARRRTVAAAAGRPGRWALARPPGPLDRPRPRHHSHLHRSHVPGERRDRSTGQAIRSRRRSEQGSSYRRGSQPRRPGADHPARQPHRQPGDARPHL